MKLLTTGGLLYSGVHAANADGTSGSFESFDYVAMLPELMNGGLNRATGTGTTLPVNIGWNPVVTEILSTYDGGKVIAGIGKLTGTIYAGWVVKMWGTAGANPCSTASKITGYVTMALGLKLDLGAVPTNCALTANAKVMWAWTNAVSTTALTKALQYSYVITGASEAWIIGAASTAGVAPLIIVAGGWTNNQATELQAAGLASFGMGTWAFNIDYVTEDGEKYATTTPQVLGTILAMENIYKATTNASWFTAANAASTSNLELAMNHCWTAVQAHSHHTGTAKRSTVAGFSGGAAGCLKHAIDGFSFWGGVLIATIGDSFIAASFALANAPAISAVGAIITQQYGGWKNDSFAGLNFTSPRVVHEALNLTATEAGTTANIFTLCTSAEFYYRPVLITQIWSAPKDVLPTTGTSLTTALHGQIWDFWLYVKKEATAKTFMTAVNNSIIFVGTMKGQGTLSKWDIGTTMKVLASIPFTTGGTTVRLIDAPTGGVGQFKGLTYTSTSNGKYIQTICKGVQPMYYTTWTVDLEAGVGNGFVVQCYTGIPQCAVSLIDAFSRLTATETATCMNDPRYLTWRSYTVRILYAGALSWYRTDSYWNSSKSMYSSTLGTGIVLSTNVYSVVDNNSATVAKGQTFVFAYGDGSGIQLNHIAFGTTPHASNNTAGAGTNTLSTAPSSFTNTSPNLVNEQFCLGSNLELTGTTDTSGLSSTITEWSDGYKAKITLNLETILPGATGGWRGVCMVYYSSQYVMDNTNGAVCFAAAVSSATGKGPNDFAAGYLMHVASSVWQPPANKASLQPNSSTLTGGKYAIVYTPSAATAFMYTEGYYATVQWYQPKYASSYAQVPRYGKDDYVGAYCIQGAGSNSYFGSPASSKKLTGAMYLAVGVISLGTVLSLAI